jgi:uncharacterized protein
LTGERIEPVRTCVACRTRRGASALVRMRRRSDGVVVPDAAHRRSGRSAWVCPTRGCFATAVRRRAFHRALAGAQRLAVRDPELSALWTSVLDDVDARLALLVRTTAGDPRSSAQVSALAALQSSLQAAGEVA